MLNGDDRYVADPTTRQKVLEDRLLLGEVIAGLGPAGAALSGHGFGRDRLAELSSNSLPAWHSLAPGVDHRAENEPGLGQATGRPRASLVELLFDG